jgi:hypothetical protein
LFFQFGCRLLVQKSLGKYVYSCQIVSATTNEESPFAVKTAQIELIATDGITDFVAPIRIDDIVQLQVWTRNNIYERIVWKNAFEGRILNIEASYGGNKNTITLSCVGHEYETATTLVEEAYIFNNNDPDQAEVAIDPLFHWTVHDNCSRLYVEDEPLYGCNITTDFKVVPYQKYVKDLLLIFEKITAYTWYTRVVPTYNADHTLIQPILIEFVPVPTVADITNKLYYPTYSIIQGTPRYLSGSFTAKGDSLYTYAIEVGGTAKATTTIRGTTYTEGTQYIGSAINNENLAIYGKRTFTETDTGIEGNDMCAKFAGGIVGFFNAPVMTAQVTLQGTPEAHANDLIPVIIKKIDVNGESINNYMHIKKVSHEISANKYNTIVDIGFPYSSPQDYLLEFASKSKLSMSNFVQ